MKYSILCLLALTIVPLRTAATSGNVVKDTIVSQNKNRTLYPGEQGLTK